MSSDLEIVTCLGKELSDSIQTELFELFGEVYDQANHEYLVASFDVLRWISIARDNGQVVGFAVGDTKKLTCRVLKSLNLWRWQEFPVFGMSIVEVVCSFSLRSHQWVQVGELDANQPFLFCGRMAHSASYQAMARSANNTVPAANQVIRTWHREMVARLVELFRVEADIDTCRVIGKGKPVGYPRLEYDSTEEDDQLIAPVDRGDSLLAMSWRPEAPAGWLE